MKLNERKSDKSIRIQDVKSEHPALIETRSVNLDKRIVEGYAVVWDSKNDYQEVFHRGSFAKSIQDKGPDSTSKFTIKFRHEHNETIGLMAELIEDEIGLYFRTYPLDKGDLEDEVLRKLKSGVFNNFSIGFRYARGKYTWDEETETLYVFEANLFEISVVGIPSDQQTFLIRSNEEHQEKLSDDTESFILSLPKDKQLNARHLFAIYQTLMETEPLDPKEKALTNKNEQRDEDLENRSIDFDYIYKNY